jgi:hypothetical protein
MPYKLKGNCVVKADTGETVKCHGTHGEAAAHLAALEANVSDADSKSKSSSGGSASNKAMNNYMRKAAGKSK